MSMLNQLKDTFELERTENGAIKRNTTKSMLLDLFALGGAYRTRSNEDIFNLFYDAYVENPEYALKCLFYLRNVRGGQGERNFFKVCLNRLAFVDADAVERNLRFVPELGRWDDFYCLVGTPVEEKAFAFLRAQLELDIKSKTPSLLAKWLKSENTSSKESRRLATVTRKHFELTSQQYRKILSELRKRINVVERLMSENRWDEIEFDKIPSRAGFIYRNAFARRDIIKEKYKTFAEDKATKVNASTLYPYECVAKALDSWSMDETERAMINKYWDNLTDYINGKPFNGIVMADTSGSMIGTPMNVAVSLALYCATKCSGPYANHFITFSTNPYLCEIKGYDFVNKCERISNNDDWGGSTNIEAAMELLLSTALKHNLSQSDVPENLVIVSDMEFNDCASAGPVTNYRWGVASNSYRLNSEDTTLFETIEKRWADCGYKMPHITFWNVNCRNGKNIPMKDNGYVNFVSGFSPVLFEQLLECKTAYDLMMEVLNKDIYKDIR